MSYSYTEGKNMALGQRVKEVREQKGMTQAELAEHVSFLLNKKIKQGNIANLENRDSRKSEIAYELASALNVNADWLITGNGLKEKPPKTAKEIASMMGVAEDPNFFGVEVPAEKSVDHLFSKVPKYDVELSAGHGSSVAEEDGNGFLYFRKDWIERKELSEDKLAVVYIKGDSMEPTVNNGDVILVDTSEYYTHIENIDDGFVYAINIDGEAMVKRLFKKPGGAIIIRSDSTAPQYQDMILEKADLQYLRIIGRAIWRAGDI